VRRRVSSQLFMAVGSAWSSPARVRQRCGARWDMAAERPRALNPLGKLVLRHGQVWSRAPPGLWSTGTRPLRAASPTRRCGMTCVRALPPGRANPLRANLPIRVWATLAGRGMSQRDEARPELVVVVGSLLARQFDPERSAVKT
jgi:hypothetical protein